MNDVARRKAEDDFLTLLEKAQNFSIKVHSDFAELGVLSDALHDTLNIMLPEIPKDLQIAFDVLDDAVFEGKYMTASWKGDGSLERAEGALAELIMALGPIADKLDDGDA